MLSDVVCSGCFHIRSMMRGGSRPNPTRTLQPAADVRLTETAIAPRPSTHPPTMSAFMDSGFMRRVYRQAPPDTVPNCTDGRARVGSVVEHDTEQRAFHLEPAVVFDESQLAELVHEEVHAGPR